MTMSRAYRGEDYIFPREWREPYTPKELDQLPSAQEMDDAMDLMNLQIEMQGPMWFEMSESEKADILKRIEEIESRYLPPGQEPEPESIDDNIPF